MASITPIATVVPTTPMATVMPVTPIEQPQDGRATSNAIRPLLILVWMAVTVTYLTNRIKRKKTMNLRVSRDYRERADKVLTTSPFSKAAQFYGGDDPSAYPQYLAKAVGARVWDVDGNEYLDWVSGLGATILGHGDVRIIETIQNVARFGVGLSLPHRLEVEVAEKLAAFCPIDDAMVRWCKTGSGACAAAVRLARAVTGRHRTLSIGYHGYHDTFIAASPPAWGVPPELAQTIMDVPANDLLAIEERLDSTTACVILEHGVDDPDDDYYDLLARLCHNNGSLLIMDEIVTSLRWERGSVCHLWDVDADMICYGKALANGYPLAALVGRREYMQWFNRIDPVFVSTTFAGEPCALSAANVVLDVMDDKARKQITDVGRALMSALNRIGDGVVDVVGHPCRSLVTFPYGDDWLCDTEDEAWLARGLFVQEMARLGFIVNRPNFATLAHVLNDAVNTSNVAEEALATVQREQRAGALAKTMAGRVPRRLFSNR